MVSTSAARRPTGRIAPWAVFAVVWTFSGAANAQPPGRDPQSTIEPRSGPGAGQEYLRKFVGEWDVAKAFYPRGGGEPSRAQGTCRQTMIHDGRFLQSEFAFGTGQTKTTGLGLVGFEPGSGKFTSVWTDSRQTRMSFRQSPEMFDGRRIVLFGQGLGGDAPARRSKTVSELADGDNKIVHRQYSVAADGQERLVMELILTRKPTGPAK
jgi:hypothetical protein